MTSLPDFFAAAYQMDLEDLDRAIGELIRIYAERAGAEQTIFAAGEDSAPPTRCC